MSPNKNQLHKEIIKCVPFIFDTQAKIMYYKSNYLQKSRVLSSIINENRIKL